MRILGIDPGFATIGFGLVEADRGQVHMVTYGAITTPAGLPLSRRLYQIGTDMEELIGRLAPEVISIEELFFNTNITTGIAVAHGRGVLLYAAEKCGVPLYEYTPSQVKLAVTGYGKAEKRQVMDMTRRLLKLQKIPRPDDAADALALALCHARSATSRLPQGRDVRETV
ncbi:crossover junction endodeoxyribonuclease RuvC [uncultured Oscillibacter sp.]|uniref:crossover junction endodeoxyribonuclease RuvC n=1 Tax=uncultured Oscillibacter sp. TaxID=876091 RepID=UPI0025D523B1|nr:crossover junction endodeoxyribonuclease RuvC [uncultured Oscillibacter sp.]